MKLAPISEKEFLQQIMTLCKLTGTLVYHTHDSRHSQSGFPDLVMIKEGRLTFAELKSESGKLTVEQAVWLEELKRVTEPPVVRLWRPSDWLEIERLLQRRNRTRW